MSKQRHVLLVDDDEDVLIACQEALEEEGYLVSPARTGAEALALVEGETFDAAVVDLVLPDMEGLRIMEALRGRDAHAVVILITGFASLESALHALHGGAYDYLEKPFRPEAFLRSVARGCEQRELVLANLQLVQELEAVNEQLRDHQKRLEEKVRVATSELGELVALGSRLARADGIDASLHEVLAATQRLTGARAAAIYLMDETGQRLRGRAALGLIEAEVRRREIVVGAGLLGKATERGQPIVENDILGNTATREDLLAHMGLRSVAATPLVLHGRVRGVLAAFDKDRDGFGAPETDLLQALAAVAVALLDAEKATDRDTESDQFIPLTDFTRRR